MTNETIIQGFDPAPPGSDRTVIATDTPYGKIVTVIGGNWPSRPLEYVDAFFASLIARRAARARLGRRGLVVKVRKVPRRDE